jgi:hypothetical protein
MLCSLIGRGRGTWNRAGITFFHGCRDSKAYLGKQKCLQSHIPCAGSKRSWGLGWMELMVEHVLSMRRALDSIPSTNTRELPSWVRQQQSYKTLGLHITEDLQIRIFVRPAQQPPEVIHSDWAELLAAPSPKRMWRCVPQVSLVFLFPGQHPGSITWVNAVSLSSSKPCSWSWGC